MKIQAYMPVFNESDVLPYVLQHMWEQGVEVHILDGWSTDGSFELASRLGVTIERFPAAGPAKEQACRAILRRVEDLASQSDADWCMLSDADEWRRSSRPGETLAHGVARIEDGGYNVIDHNVFAFYCTDAGWTGNPEEYFSFYDTKDMICRLPQEKLWKNLGMRVNLHDSGGHEIKFPSKWVAPEKFLMKHYPFRTPDQARQKLATRLDRRCKDEHKDGWGVHYDEFKPEFSFCWDPAQLQRWAA